MHNCINNKCNYKNYPFTYNMNALEIVNANTQKSKFTSILWKCRKIRLLGWPKLK